jgi:tetratricopeptide (TPR) repeat protein
MTLTEPHVGKSPRRRGLAQAKDLLMRYFPAALALSLLLAVTASASLSAPPEPLDPRAAALEAQGRAALAGGDNAKATDDLEAALALQPGNATIVLDLAQAARQRSMPGEALHYYRVVLTDDPQNINGLAGEGAALAEMGALDKAKRNLAQVQGLCGQDCAAARTLADAIARGPKPLVATAVAIKPLSVVTTN